MKGIAGLQAIRRNKNRLAARLLLRARRQNEGFGI
jgi:hypothetical protein